MGSQLVPKDKEVTEKVTCKKTNFDIDENHLKLLISQPKKLPKLLWDQFDEFR